MVEKYLLKNPEIIIEALDTYKRRQQEAEKNAIQRALIEQKSLLSFDPNSPVGGNLTGDVTIVEFFDYRCGVCKNIHQIVKDLVKNDGKLRRVYKEWPILGPDSSFAAKAALASRSQGKYILFHNALMEFRGPLSPQKILLIAANIGLNVERLRIDMNNSKITEIIQKNFTMAKSLQINGTPSFVIGTTIVRGARDLDTLKRIVNQTRKAK